MMAVPMRRPVGAARARREPGGGWNAALRTVLARAATPQARTIAAMASATVRIRRGRKACLLWVSISITISTGEDRLNSTSPRHPQACRHAAVRPANVRHGHRARPGGGGPAGGAGYAEL